MGRACLLLLYDVLLISLALEDMKFRKIRNHYIAGILFLAAGSVFVMRDISVGTRLLGMVAVNLPMSCIALVKPGSFGGGDVKLTFACGAFLGLERVVQGTVIAVFLAGVYCIYLICVKRKRTNMQFAMGPFLSAGYLLTAFTLF